MTWRFRDGLQDICDNLCFFKVRTISAACSSRARLVSEELCVSPKKLFCKTASFGETKRSEHESPRDEHATEMVEH